MIGCNYNCIVLNKTKLLILVTQIKITPFFCPFQFVNVW